MESTKVAESRLSRHRDPLLAVFWSLANVAWSVAFAHNSIPVADYLFPAYLLASLYGWLKWLTSDNGQRVIRDVTFDR